MVAIFYGNHDIAQIVVWRIIPKVDVRGEDGATPGDSLAIWRGNVELAALMPPEARGSRWRVIWSRRYSSGGGQVVDTLLASSVPPTASDRERAYRSLCGCRHRRSGFA